MRAPNNFRLHIGIFGMGNTGKSSILNALVQQEVSIVSEIAGTTTDPVEKTMELMPLGPVVFIDTAGIDDKGKLGEQRVAKTVQVIDRTDLGLIITNYNSWGEYEIRMVTEFEKRNVPFIIVFNKSDIYSEEPAVVSQLKKMNVIWVETSTVNGSGLADLNELILEAAPVDYINQRAILADLVGPGELAVLVVPIDKEAPKGRLILPQVQSIRDLLNHHSLCMVVRDTELHLAFDRLREPPRLVVTDSQAFQKVASVTPSEVLLTSFSILFARYQGDLVEMVKGVHAVDNLRKGDKVLIAEACSHHPLEEDIGTVKIPRWLNHYVGGELEFCHIRGYNFPQNLSSYKLIVHCGACMWNRKAMLNRILKAQQAGVPITNYGLAIAYSLGILERALQPFTNALKVLTEEKKIT